MCAARREAEPPPGDEDRRHDRDVRQMGAAVVGVLNDPYDGGTHLPDITIVSPVFIAGRRLGFAASRAHHADVGGDTPGSMPAYSTELSQEGVVIPPTLLV